MSGAASTTKNIARHGKPPTSHWSSLIRLTVRANASLARWFVMVQWGASQPKWYRQAVRSGNGAHHRGAAVIRRRFDPYFPSGSRRGVALLAASPPCGGDNRRRRLVSG